ncbi:hypothetical protein [Nocardioides sp.]|uniref:hypothetical protein n=1 Tax=Nocardioides sp. TaxID=35761 RepID=UPI0031FEE006|nr:hypothetical protein [Nocardioides sp.]
MLRRTLFGSTAVVISLVMLLAGTATAAGTYWGTTGAPDRVLRAGCHNYPYHYRVRPHGHDWSAETFLVDPTGDGLSSGAFDPDSDPRTGRSHFRICRASTRAGRFTIRMKVSIYDGPNPRVHWVKRSHFHLSHA